ncbi:unnamed protein product [Sphagnum jensenii]
MRTTTALTLHTDIATAFSRGIARSGCPIRISPRPRICRHHPFGRVPLYKMSIPCNRRYRAAESVLQSTSNLLLEVRRLRFGLIHSCRSSVEPTIVIMVVVKLAIRENLFMRKGLLPLGFQQRLALWVVLEVALHLQFTPVLLQFDCGVFLGYLCVFGDAQLAIKQLLVGRGWLNFRLRLASVSDFSGPLEKLV